MTERQPVRIRGTTDGLMRLLNTPGVEVTPGTAGASPDAKFEVYGYATNSAIDELQSQGLDVHQITPVEAQPFEIAAARSQPPIRFVAITGTAEAFRALPPVDHLTLHDHGTKRIDGNRFIVYGTASDAAITVLRERGLDVEPVVQRGDNQERESKGPEA